MKPAGQASCPSRLFRSMRLTYVLKHSLNSCGAESSAASAQQTQLQPKMTCAVHCGPDMVRELTCDYQMIIWLDIIQACIAIIIFCNLCQIWVLLVVPAHCKLPSCWRCLRAEILCRGHEGPAFENLPAFQSVKTSDKIELRYHEHCSTSRFQLVPRCGRKRCKSA